MIKKYSNSNFKRYFSVGIIWIDGGSNLDGKRKKGINQILCNLLVRGCEGFDNFALSDFIESYGAELNQEVFEDGMLISIKSLDTYFDKLFPLLNLIINKPILSKKQFQIVKQYTINSIKKDRENPFNITYECWRKIVYSEHPYGFNSLGYIEDVSNISYNDVLSEYERFKSREKYLISNNLRSKEHNIDNENLENFNEKIGFSNYDLKRKFRFVSSYKNSNQVIIMLGNQTCPRRSIEYLPLKILESYLSYGMSSKLFRLFREKNGMTYDVGVFNPVRKENAPFVVYLSVSNKNALKAFKLLSVLWSDLLVSPIKSEDLTLAKEKLKGSILIRKQSLEETLQKEILFISYKMSPNSDLIGCSEMEKITSEDIQNVAKKYLSKPFLSITGSSELCSKIKRDWINNFSY